MMRANVATSWTPAAAPAAAAQQQQQQQGSYYIVSVSQVAVGYRPGSDMCYELKWCSECGWHATADGLVSIVTLDRPHCRPHSFSNSFKLQLFSICCSSHRPRCRCVCVCLSVSVCLLYSALSRRTMYTLHCLPLCTSSSIRDWLRSVQVCMHVIWVFVSHLLFKCMRMNWAGIVP